MKNKCFGGGKLEEFCLWYGSEELRHPQCGWTTVENE